MTQISARTTEWRGWLFPWISTAYLLLIYGLPTLGVIVAIKDSGRYASIAAAFAPLLWSIQFLLTASILSMLHQFSIMPGKFRRSVNDRCYFHRRLYGTCWTAVFYNKPVYFLCLSIPVLKRMTFRIFGYRGSMSFTVYPDTWIRDLPLLHFEDGAYVSNRATLGTNIVLKNGFLLVDRITLRSNSLVGHLAMLAPGVELEAGAEVGVGGGIGIRARLGRNAFIGPCCVIEHGVKIGDNSAIGAHSFVGSGSQVANGIRLPACTSLSPRTNVIAERQSTPEEPATPWQPVNHLTNRAEKSPDQFRVAV